MRDSSFFVRSTDLTHAKAALINGQPAAQSYKTLIGLIEDRAGAEAAALFAEPIFPADASDARTVVSWYSVHEGNVVELDALDEAAQKPAIARLRDHVEALTPLLNDERVGPALSSWLNLTSPDDILVVGGEPVLVNWGYLPEGAEVSEEARRRQFAQTLGRFTKGLPLPQMRASLAEPVAGAPDSNTARFSVEGEQSMQDQEPGVPRNRPWLAPLIATAIALATLLVLLIPGVLRYPEADAGAAAARVEEDRLRASNDSLEQQLKALEAESANRTCRPANLSIPVPGIDNGAVPPPQMEAIPRPPEKVILPPAAGSSQNGTSNISQLLDNATVLVIGVKLPGYTLGSGFFISNNRIVTNHHVIVDADPDSIFVLGRGIGGIRKAKLLAKTFPPPTETDINPDVAVLEIEPVPGQQGLKLGATPMKLSTAYVGGFPAFLTEKDQDFKNFIKELASAAAAHNLDSVLSRSSFTPPSADLRYGRINNTMKSGSHNLPIIIHDMQLAKGNSGGPLVDACGNLGGINTLLFPNEGSTQQGNVAQDVSIVRRFLQESNIPFQSEDNACNPTVASNEPR